MFDMPQIMHMAQSMARHAAARQGIVAANVANSDTPGYAARDLRPFAETYRTSTASQPTGTMRATRAGHAGLHPDAALIRIEPDPAPATRNPNGNTVSVEREMMRAVDIRQSHERALGIYATARNILRASLGR